MRGSGQQPQRTRYRTSPFTHTPTTIGLFLQLSRLVTALEGERLMPVAASLHLSISLDGMFRRLLPDDTVDGHVNWR